VLRRLAERNLAPLTYAGKEVTPMELASLVSEQREQYRWLPDDLTLDQQYRPQFTVSDIDELRVLRRLLSDDLIYDADTLPDPSSLPDLARVIAAHGQLGRIDELEAAAKSGEIPYMRPDLQTARSLRDWVVGFADFMEEVGNEPWLLGIYHVLLGLKRVDPAPLTALKEALLLWVELHRQGREYDLQAVICDHAEDPTLDRALEDLTAGRRPFGIFSMFKGGLKAKVETISIEGRSPSNPDDWQVVRRYRAWQQEAHRFVGRWGGIARAFRPVHARRLGQKRILRPTRGYGPAKCRLQYLEDRVPNHVRREPLAHANGQDVVQPSIALCSSLEHRGDAEIIFARIDRLTRCQPRHNFRRSMSHTGVSNVDECAVIRL
jgi:hypothetical protein